MSMDSKSKDEQIRKLSENLRAVTKEYASKLEDGIKQEVKCQDLSYIDRKMLCEEISYLKSEKKLVEAEKESLETDKKSLEMENKSLKIQNESLNVENERLIVAAQDLQ